MSNSFEGADIGGQVSRKIAYDDLHGERPRTAYVAHPGSIFNGIRATELTIVFIGGRTLVGADAERFLAKDDQ